MCEFFILWAIWSFVAVVALLPLLWWFHPDRQVGP